MATEGAVLSKWEGRSTAELRGPTADQVWPLVADFCNIHRWFPAVAECRLVGGPAGKAGMIRRCVAAADSEGKTTTRWAEERLVAIDPVGREIRYEIVDNNMGFKSYVATWKVVEINNHSGSEDVGEKEQQQQQQQQQQAGCRLEWSFVADPVEGWRHGDLLDYIDATLKAVASKMEEALTPASTMEEDVKLV